MNCKPAIKWQDGTFGEKVNKERYLGGDITATASRTTDISNRTSIAAAAMKELELFWAKAATPVQWKPPVFNAVIISQLVFGLDSVHLTEAQIKKLDAFHHTK